MNTKISVKNLNLYYGANHALKNININIPKNEITAFIGPSGCGKSTFLKTLNRMNDLVENVKIDGQVMLDNEDIYSSKVDTTLLRKKVGMVFQQPNPFPMSIYDNIAYGPRIHGIKAKSQLDQIVEESLVAQTSLTVLSVSVHLATEVKSETENCGEVLTYTDAEVRLKTAESVITLEPSCCATVYTYIDVVTSLRSCNDCLLCTCRNCHGSCCDKHCNLFHYNKIIIIRC